MSEENPLLVRAISLGGDKGKIKEFYGEWAKDYAADMLETTGYVGHVVTAEALAAHVSGAAKILDAGCGTGLVATELVKRNPRLLIDGLDLTQEMLEEARKTGGYRTLSTGDLMGTLEIAEDSYDGVISAGVFTNGHVGPAGLDELIRVARPGAPIVLTVRDTAWEADGFNIGIKALADAGRVRILDIRPCPYHANEGVFCKLCILEAV